LVRSIIFLFRNIVEAGMKDFVRVMKALSDPNRVKIVKMLQQKKLCVCEIQAALQVAQPTVSKHLKILENAGLVDSQKDGLWVNYHLTDGQSSPFVATLLGNLKHWLEGDPDILRLREKLPSIRREDVCKR
jgi:ArsR family transcriptional regulator